LSKEKPVTLMGKIKEYAESLVIALIIALFIRAFFIQAFKIPSSSMVPTLLVGDHLLVNKFIYGTHIPFTDKVIWRIKHPKRGDIVVFKCPVEQDKYYIKRVIGEPGDTVEVKDKIVYINGKKINDPWGRHYDPTIYPRDMNPRDNFGPFKVPQDTYFVMGDNRDSSFDSRFWGPVEYKFIRGKPLIIYFSWDSKTDKLLKKIRFKRMLKLIR
jgi:signal peptidase I